MTPFPSQGVFFGGEMDILSKSQVSAITSRKPFSGVEICKSRLDCFPCSNHSSIRSSTRIQMNLITFKGDVFHRRRMLCFNCFQCQSNPHHCLKANIFKCLPQLARIHRKKRSSKTIDPKQLNRDCRFVIHSSTLFTSVLVHPTALIKTSVTF